MYLSPWSKQRKAWRQNYLSPSQAPKEFKPFAFNKAWGFDKSPEWLEEERDNRKQQANSLNYVHAITISILSPAGKEYSYKWYLSKQKDLDFADFAKCIKMFEDRHLLYLEKSPLLGVMADFAFPEEEMAINPETGKLKRKKHMPTLYPDKQELYIPKGNNENTSTTTKKTRKKNNKTSK